MANDEIETVAPFVWLPWQITLADRYFMIVDLWENSTMGFRLIGKLFLK